MENWKICFIWQNFTCKVGRMVCSYLDSTDVSTVSLIVENNHHAPCWLSLESFMMLFVFIWANIVTTVLPFFSIALNKLLKTPGICILLCFLYCQPPALNV